MSWASKIIFIIVNYIQSSLIQDQAQHCSSIFSEVMRKNMKVGQDITIQEFCHLLDLVGTSMLYIHYLTKLGEFEILIQ